jgi:hypothetical protein
MFLDINPCLVLLKFVLFFSHYDEIPQQLKYENENDTEYVNMQFQI